MVVVVVVHVVDGGALFDVIKAVALCIQFGVDFFHFQLCCVYLLVGTT